MKKSVRKEVRKIMGKAYYAGLYNSIEEFVEHVDWHQVSQRYKLSEDFIKEFLDELSLCGLSEYQDLSEDFIREFRDEWNWYNISMHQILSEFFIREFKNKVDWDPISLFQRLSESFIEEFGDDIHWYNISNNQTLILGIEFIRKFQHKLDLRSLLYNKKIDKEQMEKIIESNKIHSRFELLDI